MFQIGDRRVLIAYFRTRLSGRVPLIPGKTRAHRARHSSASAVRMRLATKNLAALPFQGAIFANYRCPVVRVKHAYHRLNSFARLRRALPLLT
jgi:hypothetical protein